MSGVGIVEGAAVLQAIQAMRNAKTVLKRNVSDGLDIRPLKFL
jgi:hypothetical protein